MGVASSQPAAPCTTQARDSGMPASVPASNCAVAALCAPTSRNRGAAGLVSGPSRLKSVRTPSAARIGASAFMAGWK